MENKNQFKSFDKVLVRDYYDKRWKCDFYSYKTGETGVQTIHDVYSIENVIPYKGNEHLVGTMDEPEEKIQVKYWEWIMALDGCLEEPSNEPSDWYLEQFNNISGEDNIETKRGCHYHYFIRFSDFNLNNMEETRKHILCVKNSKIVKY